MNSVLFFFFELNSLFSVALEVNMEHFLQDEQTRYFIGSGYYEHTYVHDLLFIYLFRYSFIHEIFLFLPFNHHLHLFARLFLVCSTILSVF